MHTSLLLFLGVEVERPHQGLPSFLHGSLEVFVIQFVFFQSKYLTSSLLPGGELLFIYSIALATVPSRPTVPHTAIQCVYKTDTRACFGPLHCLQVGSVASDKPALSVTPCGLWYGNRRQAEVRRLVREASGCSGDLRNGQWSAVGRRSEAEQQ